MARPPSTGRFAPRVGVEERALLPEAPNGNDPDDNPPGTVGPDNGDGGDPSGFAMLGDDPQLRTTSLTASPWAGWPSDWATPLFNTTSRRFGELIDTAWAALDLNSSILSTMPPYRLRGREVLEPTPWMLNPDPDHYSSWEEFAKQLFWSYQMGEVYVLPTAYSGGWPARFHVVEPWLINAEMVGGRRRFTIGSLDVTDEILPIRYKSTTDDARGHGPLEAGQSRVVAAGVLARYATRLAQTGGVPFAVIKTPRQLTQNQVDALLSQWWQSRMDNLGLPAVLSGGAEIEAMQVSPKDMALLDLAQFNEARIAVLLGVPPFLLGLPSGGDSMTYSNVSALFDYHWRAGLRPKASPVMAALSAWALPPDERIELNRDEYVRPGFTERASAWSTLHAIEDDTGRAITADEIRNAERLTGDQAAATLNGVN